VEEVESVEQPPEVEPEVAVISEFTEVVRAGDSGFDCSIKDGERPDCNPDKCCGSGTPVSTTFDDLTVETCQNKDTTQHWYKHPQQNTITKMDFECIELSNTLVASAFSLISILYMTIA